MHAQALPDADPTQLARPRDVARQIVQLIGSDATPNGARLEVAREESAS